MTIIRTLISNRYRIQKYELEKFSDDEIKKLEEICLKWKINPVNIIDEYENTSLLLQSFSDKREVQKVFNNNPKRINFFLDNILEYVVRDSQLDSINPVDFLYCNYSDYKKSIREMSIWFYQM